MMRNICFSSLFIIVFLSGCTPKETKPVSVFAFNSGEPLVVLLGGSEGGYPHIPALIEAFTSRGISVAEVAYWRHPQGPRHLQEIDINTVAAAIDEIGEEHSCVGIFGVSKGAELALLLAANFRVSDATVAMVPSHVAWQSSRVTLAQKSSWVLNNKPLAFVPYNTFSLSAFAAAFDVNNSLPLHIDALRNAASVTDATIRVENIEQPVLLQGAKHDQIWPSSQMADAVLARAEWLNPMHQMTLRQYDHDHYLLTNEEAMIDVVEYLTDALEGC